MLLHFVSLSRFICALIACRGVKFQSSNVSRRKVVLRFGERKGWERKRKEKKNKERERERERERIEKKRRKQA